MSLSVSSDVNASTDRPVLVSLLPSRAMPGILREGLEQCGQLYFWPELRYEEQERIGTLASVLIGTASSRVTADTLRRFPACRMIASFGVGYDGYDMAALKRRGIVLTNTPNVLSDDVADLAFAMILNLSRGIGRADSWLREGRWPDGGFPLQTRVSGKRLGIFGLGRIGSEIARRGEAFHMQIGYTDLTGKNTKWQRFPTLKELAVWSDYLVVIVPATEATHHVVDAEILMALGTKGYLINVARGSVVNTKALIDALKTRTIAGAGLDVFENEPYVEADLKTLPNTILTPHIGTATIETRRMMADLVVRNVHAFVNGNKPITPVAN